MWAWRDGDLFMQFSSNFPILRYLLLSLSLSLIPLTLTATGVWILGCKGRLPRLRQAVPCRYLVGSGGNMRQRRLRAKETHAPSFSAGYV